MFAKWLTGFFGPGARKYGQRNASVASFATVAKLIEAYSAPVANYSRGPWYAAAAMITDYFMACPTRRAARLLSADPRRGRNSTFVYHFLENPEVS